MRVLLGRSRGAIELIDRRTLRFRDAGFELVERTLEFRARSGDRVARIFSRRSEQLLGVGHQITEVGKQLILGFQDLVRVCGQDPRDLSHRLHLRLLLSSTGETQNGRDDENHQKDEEQDLCDLGRACGNPTEAEHRGDQRDHKEHCCPVQHDDRPLD